jgi:hypothetical protein
VDDELLEVGRNAIASHYGLTPAQARRLHGDTAVELRTDAQAMRAELGLPPLDDRDRDDHGASMNRLIRSAAGR